MSSNPKAPVMGIALSGGGARGLAHIGVLAALEKNGISPQVIAGSSMGAIIGTFYAAGFSPEEIFKIARNEKLYRLFKWSMPKGGMLSLQHLRKVLETNIPGDSFSTLKKKLFVTVSNITSGTGEVISEGPLYQAVVASASIPVIFEPQIINGQTYVDGGLFNDLPIKPLIGKCDRIIASNVNYHGPEPELKNIKSIAERVYRLAIYQNIKHHINDCDLVIDPLELRQHGTFEFKNIDKLFEIGFKEGDKMSRQFLQQFKTSLIH